MIRLRDGLGWVDVEATRCVMPPDNETWLVAPGAKGDRARLFQVVEVPQLVAVFTIEARDPLHEAERAAIETLLGNHVEHVAFLQQERLGAGVVEGHGAPEILATAAAALKAIGGWDESVPIVIEANRKKIAVRCSYDGTRWHADAREVPL